MSTLRFLRGTAVRRVKSSVSCGHGGIYACRSSGNFLGYDEIELASADYSGEEVIRRHCKIPKDADEQTLRSVANKTVQEEGYEPDVLELSIRR